MDAMAGSGGATPLRVRDPERIPARRYYDPGFYEEECRALWPRVWQMACRLEEIPEVGDYAEYEILDQSVIVVRTADGVRAYHNTCRHRGVQLAKGHGNCKGRGFICPFHGWRWGIDGRNSFMFAPQIFSEAARDPASVDLVPVRVETWGGCAFVNLDPDAPPFAESLGPAKDALEARHVDRMKVDWWMSTVLPVNWKLAMEAFMESYHVMRTHPQIHATSAGGAGFDYGSRPDLGVDVRAKIDVAIRSMQVLADGMAGMILPGDVAIAERLRDIELPDDDVERAMMQWGARLNDEIVADGRARGIDMPDLNYVAATHPAEAVQFIFPHFFLLPLFGNMSSYRVRPLGPETCLFELWSLTLFPDDEPRPRPVPPVPLPIEDPRWPEVPRQDYANLPLQQRGLHSMSFEYMRLSHRAEGMISNCHRLIDGYLDGVPFPALSAAARSVNGNIDVAVADLGF